MFGISSFSEAPFSGIVDTRDAGWQEIRSNVDSWSETDFGNYRRPRLMLESLSFLLQEDTSFLLISDEFVVPINVWQDSSNTVNNWVER